MSPPRNVWASCRIGLQLALVWLVCHRFDLEAEAFRNVFAIASLGWLLQHAVPVRFRLSWFLVLAAISLMAALGVENGSSVLALSCGFVALCLLPGSRWWRLGLVLAAGVGLAWLRVGNATPPFSLAAWPIFASLFLFRAISFLYDRHHEREQPPVGLTAAYFFLPPNACFPIFPVVDFAAFRRGYEPAAGADVHQEGVERIVRGLLQLLAYRLVYQLAVVPIDAVTDSASAVQYLATNVFLIVRIMGMFHVSIGILHLFGFQLQPTTHLPFLSPGFSEFWRRANVYWRDFVVKVFFYPVYFQMKGLGRRPAQAVATLATFAAAWFLHSYQWFWFKGYFPWRWQDGVYWAAFGLLVMANGLWLSRPGVQRRSSRRMGLGGELARAARIAGTFAVFATLWSLWMAPSFATWLQMWRTMASDGPAALISVAVVLGPIALAGLLWPDPSPAARGFFAGRQRSVAFTRPWRSSPAVAAALGGLLLVGVLHGRASLPPWLKQGVAALAQSGPNMSDRARQTQAYYQDLVEIPRVDTRDWERNVGIPNDWNNWIRAGLRVPVPDIRRWAYRPSTSAPLKYRIMTINAFGMRDQEYTKEKPPGVVRIAIHGASPVAGSGIGDGETFEAVIERRLNEDAERGLGPRVEILNFATPAYNPVHWLFQVEHLVSEFDVDWVVVASAKHAWQGTPEGLLSAQNRGIPIDNLKLRLLTATCVEAIRAADQEAGEESLRTCLLRKNPEAIRIVADEIVAASRERDFGVAYLQLPALVTKKRSADASFVQDLKEAGLLHLDVSDCWEGQATSDLYVARWDFHPNAFAHGLVADCAFASLRDLSDRAAAERAAR